MFKNLSIKKGFIRGIIGVVILTTLTTLFVESIFYHLLSTNSKPENYFTVGYSRKLYSDISNKSHEILKGNDFNIRKINELFKGEALKLDGTHISGDNLFKGEDLIKSINTNYVSDGYAHMYIPLQNKNGEIEGVYCAYLPFGTLEINKFSKTLLFTLIIVSPFIIFFIYAILFIALFYSDIKDNFDTFAHWIDEIKNKNLDFEIEDLGNNEFGKLARIFDDMRLELKKSTERNWIMKEERNVMVASLAHDIKTPISIIKAHCEFLYETSPTKSLKRYFDVINRNCDRMTFLLNNLVLMIQIDNNDFNLNKESVDLKKLLKNKTEEFNMICKLKKINLNVIYKECTIYEHIFDKILFERVIDNLLYNSVKFTSKGGNINIIFEEDKDKIHFVFSDTGEGFNKKMLDKYFNKFYKKDKVSNKGDEHFGLGLYISKNIIEKHDGNIRIGNNEQGGALIEGFIKTS